MTSTLPKPAQFSALLQRFFTDRMCQQRNASTNTIAAYRDTFRLLFRYVDKQYKKKASQFTLDDFDAALVLEFLEHLELGRKNCVRSRNSRLTALHSFARYVALQSIPAMHQMHQILAIPTKRYQKPLLGFLSRDEMSSVLDAPNSDSWTGRRDRLLLRLLYNTGARVSELITIRVCDVELGGSPSVRLLGKGRKQRTVPLWKDTATMVRQWLRSESLNLEQPLIPNRHGKQMTRSNVANRILVAITTAKKNVPTLSRRRISPHTFRHSTAMHMLQSGVDITVIALWLGHESPVTTHGYIEADLSMKDRALASLAPAKPGKLRYRASDALLSFLDNL